MPRKSARILTMRVRDVVCETDDARTLVLDPQPDGGDPGGYRPGQFLTVRIPTDRPGGAARCYSLCSSPLLDEPWKITVKRTAGGYASNWLCDNVRPGSVLEILKPAGTFTPHTLDGRLLLFAAGSGITPVMSIVKSVLHGGTGAVLLVYANRDERSVIFAAELAELSRRFPGRLVTVHWLESIQGLPHGPALATLAAAWRGESAYLCGPEPFMDVVTAALREGGMSDQQVHRERYSSLDSDPFAEDEVGEAPAATDGVAATVTVTIDGETSVHAWPAGTLLLDTLLAAGLDVPYSCREGRCSACACRLLEGRVEMDTNEILDQSDLDSGLVLACQSRARADRLRVGYDDLW